MMKQLCLVFFSLFSIVNNLTAQNVRISKPIPDFSNNTLTIKYDISGCGSGEYVDIKLIILDSKGDTIKPGYVTGDLGPKINCGIDKTIIWNLEQDKILIDEDIQIYVVGNKVAANQLEKSVKEAKSFSRGNILISSFFVPGLGQKKATGKGSYLIYSALVYGAIGSSIYFNSQSEKYYNEYMEATGDLQDELYDKSIKNYNMSKYSLFGAGGIWAINMIGASVKPIRIKTGKTLSLGLSQTRYNDLLISARILF